MKRITTLVFGSTLFLSAIAVNGQENYQATQKPTIPNSPIAMEAFLGDRALAYQMIVNKKLQSIPKLGFFGVTNFQSEWGEPKMNDYMVQGNLTYTIIRGVELEGGFIWNPIDGIRPSTGIILSYGNPEFLAVLNPRIDLTKNANFDALALLEYKPKITEKLNLYTRAQALYTHNVGYDFHTRSYVMLRAGLSYKDITFGAASNFDWYGPTKMNKNNFGAFVQLNLF